MDSPHTQPVPVGSLYRSTSTTPDHQCWIDGLPDELISDILTHAIPSSLDSTINQDDYLLDRSRFPITTQLVCQRWKSIALATPGLWAILRFSDTSKNGTLRFLQRSGVMPLEVHINVPDWGDSPDYNAGVLKHLFPYITPILEVIVARTWRLVITAETCSDLHELVKALPRRFEGLIELWANGGDSTDADARVALGLSAPQTRKLHIHAYALDWSCMPTCPNLQELRITESTGSSVRVDVFVKALQAFPHLKVLELENQVISLWDDVQLLETIRPFILERLEVMILKRFYMRELKLIFSLMGTPRLETLSVVGLFTATEEDMDHSTVRLDMELPVLQNLILGRFDWALEIAKELPHIKHLTFMRHQEDTELAMDRAFSSLHSYWQSLPSPLPLETLKTNGVQLSSLLWLFVAHQDSVVPLLRKISVHYSDVFASGDSEEFEEKQEEWTELSKVVEVEIFGITDAPLAARAEVHSYEEEKAWRLAWNV